MGAEGTGFWNILVNVLKEFFPKVSLEAFSHSAKSVEVITPSASNTQMSIEFI